MSAYTFRKLRNILTVKTTINYGLFRRYAAIGPSTGKFVHH